MASSGFKKDLGRKVGIVWNRKSIHGRIFILIDSILHTKDSGRLFQCWRSALIRPISYVKIFASSFIGKHSLLVTINLYPVIEPNVFSICIIPSIQLRASKIYRMMWDPVWWPLKFFLEKWLSLRKNFFVHLRWVWKQWKTG